MTFDFAPEYYQAIKAHLQRSVWGGFPDVVLHADESTVKKHRRSKKRGRDSIGATALTGKAYSAKLKLTAETLQILREKYGKQLENWWVATFGYSFECLTESEARYLTRADDADTVRTRIIAASGKGN